MDKQKQYGLLGYPLGHSFSKGFFTKKFEEEKINAVYSNFELEDVLQIKDVLAATPQLVGFNITLPHKQAIMPLLDELSDAAREISAVNVVKIIREGAKTSLKGYNTDVVGFVNSIRPLLNPSLHTKALVLGTGGASKAVVYGLNSLGVETQLVSRKRSEHTVSYEDVASLLSDYKVIVNCTPLGTFPKEEEAPEIPYSLLGAEHLLYDLVYNPAETTFMKRGAAQGAKTKNGAEMLELQALEAWNIWNEKKSGE